MANRGGEDYLDKALDQAEKFAGKKVRDTHTHILRCKHNTIHNPMKQWTNMSTREQSGHPVDSAKYRKQNEKITDKLRSMFEKATGKKVSFLSRMNNMMVALSR
jgi:glucose-6-phosphate isomerase